MNSRLTTRAMRPVCIPVTLLAMMLSLASGQSQRFVRSLNNGWKFLPDSAGDARRPSFNDESWTSVDLPHTWNAHDAYDKDPGYRRGQGTYRRSIIPDSSLSGRRLFLYFEGVNQTASVYLNGQDIGDHVGGYTAFCLDITRAYRFDTTNVLVVVADNSHNPDIPPLDADFTFYGGIYRDVWLVAVSPVHLNLLDHAGPGVYIDTPGATPDIATVLVRGAVVNETASPVQAEVRHRVLGADGATVVRMQDRVTIPARSSSTFATTSPPIRSPHLWFPEDPCLYNIITEIVVDRTTTDVVQNPFGIRWFSVDGNGFALNGKKLKLTGTNRHQDFPGRGNAVPDSYHRRDIGIVKENGFNFLRLAHYPQDPAVLDEADRRGLVIWEEVPVVNRITMSDAFAAHAEQMVTEMIRQHYNHPSIAMWGFMNEILLREPEPRPEGYREAVEALARRLNTRVKREDPSRPTTMAVSLGEVYNGTGICDVTDILGVNLYFGWYYGAFADMGTFLDTVHAHHPERPLLVSEYGAGSDERVHAAVPERFDFSTEHMQEFHRASFSVIMARDYLAGSAIWNQFDFGSAGRQDTKTALNQKGLFYFDRTPKDIAFYYRALLRDEGIVHCEREHSERAGSLPGSDQQKIVVWANTPTVTLTMDGTAIGTQRVSNGRAEFIAPLRNGVNVAVARGEVRGRPVTDQTTFRFADRVPFFSDPASPVRQMAVNAGARYSYTDPAGVVYEEDRPYTKGAWGWMDGEEKRTHHTVFGSDDDPLCQSAREGVLEYRFDVPAGLYEVELLFMEMEHDSAGARVFSVTVNDVPAASHLDLFRDAGRWRAVRHRVVVYADDDEGIHIRFAAESGRSTISGILLQRTER